MPFKRAARLQPGPIERGNKTPLSQCPLSGQLGCNSLIYAWLGQQQLSQCPLSGQLGCNRGEFFSTKKTLKNANLHLSQAAGPSTVRPCQALSSLGQFARTSEGRGNRRRFAHLHSSLFGYQCSGELGSFLHGAASTPPYNKQTMRPRRESRQTAKQCVRSFT